MLVLEPIHCNHHLLFAISESTVVYFFNNQEVPFPAAQGPEKQ